MAPMGAEVDFTAAAGSTGADFTEEDFAAVASVSDFMGRTILSAIDGYYGDEMNCYLVRQRVHTRHGWRIRRVEICD